jgi:hypothetical protein
MMKSSKYEITYCPGIDRNGQVRSACTGKTLKKRRAFGGYNPDMEAVHKKNAARLAEIVDETGYPTKSKVGEQASKAVWLIVQHAIREPTLMKRCWQLMGGTDDVNPQNLAYLYDRICYFEGRPQKYGTQFDSRGLYPVEDKKEMIRLRRELILKAHDKDMVVESKADLHANLHPNNKTFNEWRKKVGWI